MRSEDSKILRSLESLSIKTKSLLKSASSSKEHDAINYSLGYLGALANSVSDKAQIFGIEPWHIVHKNAPLSAPGEYLLRIKDSAGEPMPPYPAIITFYNNNLMADIDTALFLCALNQFKNSDEKQISFNISSCSLQDPDFIKTALNRVEAIDFDPKKKIILEIHETTPNTQISPKVIELFKKFDISFAIDDIGLSMNDVFRLSAFENMADFVKIDRSCIQAPPENPNSLDHALSLVSTTFPDATIIAEGVQSADHAFELLQNHPEIHYVQGLYLPKRVEFSKQWRDCSV